MRNVSALCAVGVVGLLIGWFLPGFGEPVVLSVPHPLQSPESGAVPEPEPEQPPRELVDRNAPRSLSLLEFDEPVLEPRVHANGPAAAPEPQRYALPTNRFEGTLDACRRAEEVVLNNIANAQTTAFKRMEPIFADLEYRHLVEAGAQDGNGQLTPDSVAIGLGTQIVCTKTDFRQGSLIESGRALDLAIVGDGWFQVDDGGEIVYTRAGNFSLNADGQLVTSSADRGRLVAPAISVPQDATEILVSSEGIVSVRQAGVQGLTQIGQIQIARFTNPGGLRRLGENLFAEAPASGTALVGTPGTDGLGSLRQAFVEASNVDVDGERRRLGRLRAWRRSIVAVIDGDG